MVFNIVVSCCCKRKFLKRNWSWRNNRLFCHIFVIGKILIEGDLGPLSPPPPAFATPMLQVRKTKKVFANFLRGFRRFPTKRNFNCSKNSAVLEPRTGQFSRIWRFEAKAKDLTFEANAKDFKMCPRGQGRPRGLHLCKTGASPAGGQCPPDFRFCPPDFFLAPTEFFWEEEVAVIGRKKR